MKKNELMTGILTFLCMGVFSMSPGLLVLYNKDTSSLVIAFLTIFSTSFFISGIKDKTDIDTFYSDIFIGIAGVLFTGTTIFFGSSKSFVMFSAMSIFVILIFKLTWKKKKPINY